MLVVEDSRPLQKVLGAALRKSGYAVDLAADGEEGLWMAESNPYDVIVLDVMLPKKDGLAVLVRLREHGSGAHVLLLTARDTVQDRVRGLRGGADDYLVKPFALEELLARVEALCRRGYGSKGNQIAVGELHIDTVARQVDVKKVVLDLTAREFALLEYLARRQGAVVTRTEIEEHIYDASGDVMSNAVDSAICGLRKKIGTATDIPFIRTRRGMGYMLSASREDSAGK